MDLAYCRWSNASLLQKSIRRNLPEYALLAAERLALVAPEYLVRRLGVIALEDCGPANLKLVQGYFAQIPELLRDPYKVFPWVSMMCSSLKSRLLCELSFVYSTHPVMKRLARELASLSVCERWKRLDEEEDVLAKYAILQSLPFRDVMDWVESKPRGREWAATIRCARRLRTEGMEIGLPLVLSIEVDNIKIQSFQTPDLLAGFPSFTFDQHTRLGKRAYQRFAKCLPEICLPFSVSVNVIGEILFSLEGGLLDREAIFSCHEALKPMVLEALTPEGVNLNDMARWTELIQQRLPLLKSCKYLQISKPN